MSSPSITTVVTLLETLPENIQARVVEHLREFLMDLQDEAEWDDQFEGTQAGLLRAAQTAKNEIAEGLARPLDYDQL